MLPEPLLQCGSRNENNRHVQAARSAALPRNALIHIRFLVLPARAVIRYSCCTVNKSNTGLSVPSCLWLQVALAVLHCVAHCSTACVDEPRVCTALQSNEQCSVSHFLGKGRVGPAPGTDGLVVAHGHGIPPRHQESRELAQQA